MEIVELYKPKKRSFTKKRKLKKKPTSTTKADTLFSRHVRERDGRCVYPDCPVTDTKKLQCSHFFARAISATRYDPDNADALCYKHHYGDRIRGWEYLKQTEYREFKLNQLGQERYEALCERAKSGIGRREAIKIWEDQQKETNHTGQ